MPAFVLPNKDGAAACPPPNTETHPLTEERLGKDITYMDFPVVAAVDFVVAAAADQINLKSLSRKLKVVDFVAVEPVVVAAYYPTSQNRLWQAG